MRSRTWAASASRQGGWPHPPPPTPPHLARPARRHRMTCHVVVSRRGSSCWDGGACVGGSHAAEGAGGGSAPAQRIPAAPLLHAALLTQRKPCPALPCPPLPPPPPPAPSGHGPGRRLHLPVHQGAGALLGGPGRPGAGGHAQGGGGAPAAQAHGGPGGGRGQRQRDQAGEGRGRGAAQERATKAYRVGGGRRSYRRPRTQREEDGLPQPCPVARPHQRPRPPPAPARRTCLPPAWSTVSRPAPRGSRGASWPARRGRRARP